MPIAAAAAVDICQPTAKKKRKEVDLAANNGSGRPTKRVRKQCNVDGCGNWRVEGGVCIRHGAKVEYKLCSGEECTNQAKSDGVCIRHGAKKKLCSVDDCTKQAQKGGLCIRHGAKLKRCSGEECTNQAQKGGVCVAHGANGDRCKFEGCIGKGDFSGFCSRHQEHRPNKNDYNLQIQQQQFQQQQQILRMRLASTMSSLGYRHHPPQWNNNYYYDNSFLDSNRVIFEGCNIVAMHGGFCFAHCASSVAPHARADIQRGCVQRGRNQNAATEIIIDAEEAGEKKQGLITSRKKKEGVAKQSKTPPSCDTGEYCPDESEQDGRGHRCAVEDGQSHDSDKSLAAGVANLKDDNEQDTSDMRPQRRIRREGNLKDDEEQGASNVAPTQGGDEGRTGDAMEEGDSWCGDGQNEYCCEGVDNGDVNSEEGKQSHVVPEEIIATANGDEKEHEIEKKSVVAELEEELEAKTTEMDTQLMTTATSRLEERVAKDAANTKVEEMTKKFEAESKAVAELKKEVAALLELNASLRNQLERQSKGSEVKEEELTDDEDF
eukprot:CAMPEP_0113411716 /NCGR_PEP_ID=MMETSP0013_2-20120614/22426_1 /TAXON_ID=2843 ORGANISM="Skeletonema costatum, Strain 1716" /NCGR_SAMPLE_ID=MMETSP0013_2 /ASSEMBLY_ACC=CAM_ASM_000158 /LENGTH=547 /DNA_ID=CAMNT_0000298113 /DNA_START=88 /DNA_END=1728 /DNA_ORIENTATION=+ /assembly_acc=CAM_ASM_000158